MRYKDCGRFSSRRLCSLPEHGIINDNFYNQFRGFRGIYDIKTKLISGLAKESFCRINYVKTYTLTHAFPFQLMSFVFLQSSCTPTQNIAITNSSFRCNHTKLTFHKKWKRLFCSTWSTCLSNALDNHCTVRIDQVRDRAV